MLFTVQYSGACKQCGLFSDYSQSVSGTFSKKSGVLIIKDCPSYEEYSSKSCGTSRNLDKINIFSTQAGIDKQDISITNSIRCFSGGEVKDTSIKFCKQYLDKEIQENCPKVIITTGLVSFYSIFDSKLSEKDINIPRYSSYYRCWVVPSHSFNKIGTSAKYNEDFIQSLKIANKIVKGEDWQEKVNLDYKLILTQNDFDIFMDELESQTLVAVDIETTGLQIHKDRILGIGFSWKKQQGRYLPFLFSGTLTKTFFYNKDSNIERLKSFLQSTASKVFHNGQFDIRFLTRDFCKINGFNFDTNLASFLLDENTPHTLGYLGSRYSDLAGWKAKFKGKVKDNNYGGTSLEDLGLYCCTDCDVTLRLYNEYLPLINNEYNRLYYGLLLPMCKLLSEVELNGVQVDVPYLQLLISEYEVISKEHENNVYKLLGRTFLIDSPQQMVSVLYDELKLPIVKYNPLSDTAKKKKLSRTPSTDEEALSILLKTLKPEKNKREIEIIKNILGFRKSNKLLRTYFYPSLLDRDSNDRIHPNFSLSTARTGRTSSNSPNIQNIPNLKKIRKYISAKKGYKFIIADFSQAEVRVLASLSGCDKLKESFMASDFHSKTASDMFDVPFEEVTSDQRNAAKSINFGIAYGITAEGLMDSINSNLEDPSSYVTAEICQSYIDKYFSKYVKVKKYQDDLKKQILEKNYLETPLGRKRRFKLFHNMSDAQLNKIYNQGLNFPVQAHASDLLLILSLRIDKRLKENNLDANFVIFCHDEYVLEVKEDIIDKVLAIANEEASKQFPAIDVNMEMKVDIKDSWI
jgi:DNA polymerase I